MQNMTTVFFNEKKKILLKALFWDFIGKDVDIKRLEVCNRPMVYSILFP